MRFVFSQKTGGQQLIKSMSVNEPLPTPHRDFARDSTGETILTSARHPTSARPTCTTTQAQARQTGERSHANIGKLDCCAFLCLISVYLFSTHILNNYVTLCTGKTWVYLQCGSLISGFSSVKAVRLLLLFWTTNCCVGILRIFYVTC